MYQTIQGGEEEEEEVTQSEQNQCRIQSTNRKRKEVGRKGGRYGNRFDNDNIHVWILISRFSTFSQCLVLR